MSEAYVHMFVLLMSFLLLKRIILNKFLNLLACLPEIGGTIYSLVDYVGGYEVPIYLGSNRNYIYWNLPDLTPV